MNTTENASRTTVSARLDAEAARLAKTTLAQLFGVDPGRARALTFTAPHLIADYSKQHIDAGALHALADLAAAADFEGWRAKMFAGEIVNATENRPVKHWALRDFAANPDVKAVWERMHDFAHEIADGGQFDAIIHLEIGRAHV